MGVKSTMHPWSRVPRNLTDDAFNAIRDAILNDATRFPGASIDAAISTRATPAQVLTQVQTEVGAFSGQVNLTTLLAALGIPDVVGKPLYTCLVTDRWDARLDATRAARIDNLDALISSRSTLTKADLSPELPRLDVPVSSRQATLTFERYYTGTLATGASYTPVDKGLFGVASDGLIRATDSSSVAGITGEYYDGTAWRTIRIDGTDPGHAGALIGDGANMRIRNVGTTNPRIVVIMRMG